MAKRHHTSMRGARGSDDGGVIGNFKHRDYYAGMDSRRRMEMEDAGMIHENHAAIANLPQEVMIKPYPRTGPYMPEGIDDTIRGVDKQMDHDDSQRARGFLPKKV
jgi:hypothetical protein